jgi:hypothetical protein
LAERFRQRSADIEFLRAAELFSFRFDARRSDNRIDVFSRYRKE